MIINSNGVNIDTNTQRTNNEINNLIDTRIANDIKKTQLLSFSVNQSYTSSGATTLKTFDFNDDEMFSYSALMFEFVGTWKMTAGTSTAYCAIDMISDSGGEVALGYMSADKNTTTTVKDIRSVLAGISQYRSTAKYTRSFVCGNEGIEFDGTFSGYLRVSPSNSPTNVSINGTIKIYGIK